MKPDSVDDALTQLTYLVCDINTRETLALFKDHNAAKLYATVFPNAEMMSTIGELDADIATEQSTQHEDQTIMDIHRLRDMLACVQHLVPSTRLVDEIDNVLTETKHYEPS